VTECHSAVMRISLLDEYVTIEASHLLDSEDCDTTEGTGRYVEDLALSDVGNKLSVAVALQTIEGDVACSNVALESSSREIRIASFRLKETVLDELILDRTVAAHLAGRRVTAVEAHERIGKLVIVLALDVLIVDVLRNGVVDIKKGDRVTGYAGADVLGKCAVDINLAGYRDTAACETAVYVARLETEGLGECRPALVSESNILAGTLVLLSPVKERKLELRHALVHLRIVATLTHLSCHVSANLRDTRIICMCLVSYVQVKLGVLLDLNAKLIETLDGSVASEEVLRTRSEGDDLEVLNTDDSASDRNEVADHLRDVVSGSYRILRNIALEVAHSEVVGAVQHTAVCVATAVDHVAVAFSSSNEHYRAVKILSDQSLGSLGTEVAEEYNESVALSLLYVLDSLQHVKFILNSYGTLIEVTLVSGLDGTAALLGKNDREAVTAYSNNTKFYYRDVVH